MAVSPSTTTAPKTSYASWRSAGRIGCSRAVLQAHGRAALLYSLVQSCKLIDVPPFDYLKDVLRRLPTHPPRLVDQLTLRGWAKTFRPAA
jgi:hypothetical protein